MKVKHGLFAEMEYRRVNNMNEEDIDDPLALPLPAFSPSDHYDNYNSEQSNNWRENTQVIDNFEAYASTNEPRQSSGSSNVVNKDNSNDQQTTQSSSVTNNWVWTPPNYNRVSNPSVISFYAGTNQSAGVSSIYEYNHTKYEKINPGHVSSLNSTRHSFSSLATPNHDQGGSESIPTSALDLSPTQNVGQYRGCMANCSVCTGPPAAAAHHQTSLIQYIDYHPSHQQPEDNTNSDSRSKQPKYEPPQTALVKTIVKRETKEVSGMHVNGNHPESEKIHKTKILVEPHHNQVKEEVMNSPKKNNRRKGRPHFEDTIRCNECGAIFSKMTNLKSHMKLHELKPLPIVLNNKKGHENVQNEKKIEKDKHQYECDKCDTSYKTKRLLIRHKKIHASKKVYSCDECPSVLTESSSLVIHKRLHCGYRPFKCDICQQAFTAAGLLATHATIHTGEKPYTCASCGMSFRLLSTLKSHMRRHTGEKPFSCALCQKSFTQRAALKRHQSTHSDLKPWECKQCSMRFKEKENLRKHMALHKLKSHHTCELCGEGFKNAKKLEKHQISHIGGERPYKCSICDSRFTTAKYLTQHLKRVHERKGSITCKECHATFKRKETYEAHVRIHEGEKNFICGVCGASFSQKGTLTKHLRMHNEGNNSLGLQCKQCGIKYADKNSLEKHFNIHSKEKYADGINLLNLDENCANTYSSKKDLDLHNRLYQVSYKTNENSFDNSNPDNQETFNQKYPCEGCHQTFFRKHQLKEHHRNCLYAIPSKKPVPMTQSVPQPPSEGRTANGSSMYNPILTDNKDVDPIKLLTAVLSLTGSSCDLSSPPHTISSDQYNENIANSSYPCIPENSTQYHGQNSQVYQYNSHDRSYQDNSVQNNEHISKAQDINCNKVFQMRPDMTEHTKISRNNSLNNGTTQYVSTSHDHSLQHG